ncbi:MAG: hypothetical protein VCG02_01565, partial [Verrucomicrobiota bacterium]
MKTSSLFPILPAMLPLLLAGAHAAEVLLPRGGTTEWRYLDDAAGPGKGWRTSPFDDAGWKQGKAPLGYGERDLGTTLSFGDDEANKHMAVYFRTTFKVEDGAGEKFEALGIRLRRDDGAVVYINGREAIRSNMEAGRLAPGTPASIAVGPDDEGQYHGYVVPIDLLAKSGVNTVAVEVHQANPSSSDLYLDLEISGLLPGEAPKRDFLRDGLTALRQGNYAEGTRLLEQFPRDHPDYARTMAMLALDVYSQGLGRATDGLAFAKKAYEAAPTDRQVVRSYIKTHVLSGVLFDPATIARERSKTVAAEHRFLVTKPDLRDSALIPRKALEEDLAYLEQVLVTCFSYLELRPVDYRGALDAIHGSLAEETPLNQFRLQVAKLISLFCDGHARLTTPHAEYMPRGYAPYVAGSYEGRVYLSDGEAFLDQKHPYVKAI